MTVGLICAIPEELAHLRDVLDGVRTTMVAHASFHEGVLDGRQVVLAGAGMGKVNAAIVSTVLAVEFSCSGIVLSGVAGGLDPALDIGDVVIAEQVLQHDSGRIENGRLLRYQPGHVSFINPTEHFGYAADPAILAAVKRRLEGVVLPSMPRSAGGHDRPPRITYGTVVTGDQYIHCEATRQSLHQTFAASAAEMEGGAVAQVCESFGIPWLVIRALSDLAGRDSAFDFPLFVDRVAATSAYLVRQILPVLP
ncbi:MAG: 5'-methylthioadenosine/adenosylhomocysteine nucleosidase [Mycobacterium sp.]